MVNKYKVVLCGKTGVGKTTIFRRLCGRSDLDGKQSRDKTTEDHECQITTDVDGETVKVQKVIFDPYQKGVTSNCQWIPFSTHTCTHVPTPSKRPYSLIAGCSPKVCIPSVCLWLIYAATKLEIIVKYVRYNAKYWQWTCKNE